MSRSHRDSITLRGVSITSGKDLDLTVQDTIMAEPTTVRGVTRYVNRLYAAQSNGFSGVGWIIDDDIPVCMVCGRDFGFFFRRHHCRSCGDLVCYLCSPDTAVIHEMQELGPQRVCVQCNWGQAEVFAARCRPTVPPSLALPVDTSQDSDSSSSSSASTDGFQAMPAVLPPGPEPDSDDDAALAPVCAPTPTSELHPPQRILIFLPAVDSQEPVVARCTEVAVPPGCDWAVLSEAIADSADAADHSDAAAWLRAGCAELCLSQASEGSDLLSLLSVPLSSADGQAFWALSSLADAGGSRRGFLVRRKTDRTPPDRAPADEALSLLMSLDLSRRPADEESDTEAHDGEEVQAESPADQPTPLKAPRVSIRQPRVSVRGSGNDSGDLASPQVRHRKISPADLQLLNMAYTPVADRARHSDGDDLADPAASEDSTLLSTPATASLAWTDGSATARPDEPALIIPPRRASVALQMDAVPTDAANSVALMSEFTARGCIDISVYLSSACVAAAIKKRQLKERRAQSIFEAHASGPAERRALVGFRAFATATGEALAAASEEPQSEEPDPVAAEEVQGPVPKQDPEPEVDAPLELLQAFHELSERTARETDGSKDGVSFAALQQWVPLQEAVSEGLLSVPEMATSLRLVRGADETSVADRLVEHLSLREFVELALVLQQSIDRAISAQTASGAHDAAAAEGAFDIDGYSNRRLDEFISDAAGSTRRQSLSISRSVSAEKDGNMPSFAPDAMAADDGLASHILPHLKTCMGNLYKQGHRVKNWKLRRFVLSGLRLSYYSGKVQKGEFSLKGERCEVIAGQAAPDTSGRVAVTTVSESIGMHPFSFTIVNHDLGRFLNLYAESSADLQKWVDAVSFNVRLSQSLLAGGDAPVAPASETASLSAPEDRPAAVVAPDAPSVGSLDGVYASLLRSGEHVCMAGEVVKRNKFTRMQEVRHLVLITPPRLMFVDMSSMEMKTEVALGADTSGRPAASAEQSGPASFLLQTSIKGGKAYPLEVSAQAAHSAQEWVAAINGAC